MSERMLSTVMLRTVASLWMLPRNAAIAFMRLWRRFISPLYGPPLHVETCRFEPTCSAYAVEAFHDRGFVVGTALVMWRLLRCNPFVRGGFDPVPQHHHHGANPASRMGRFLPVLHQSAASASSRSDAMRPDATAVLTFSLFGRRVPAPLLATGLTHLDVQAPVTTHSLSWAATHVAQSTTTAISERKS